MPESCKQACVRLSSHHRCTTQTISKRRQSAPLKVIDISGCVQVTDRGVLSLMDGAHGLEWLSIGELPQVWLHKRRSGCWLKLTGGVHVCLCVSVVGLGVHGHEVSQAEAP